MKHLSGHRAAVVSVALCVAAAALRAAPTPADLRRLIAVGAELQLGVTLRYDDRYQKLPYPGGDVAMVTGACSDVVVRAFRHAGIDLQVEVHEDIVRGGGRYPRLTRGRPDPSIDHRRVSNLRRFFERRGKALPAGSKYEPGDVVAWRLANGRDHIGVVSTFRTRDGRPLFVHNVGGGARLDDLLGRYGETAHYRW